MNRHDARVEGGKVVVVADADASAALNDRDLHRVVIEGEREMRTAGAGGDHCFEALGIDEIDTIIAPEGLAFDLEPVVVLLGVAFFGIDDQWLAVFGQLSVGHQIHTMISNKPEAGLFALSGFEAILGIAEAAIGLGVGATTCDDVVDGLDRESQHGRSSVRPRWEAAGSHLPPTLVLRRPQVTAALDPDRHHWRPVE